MCRQSRFSTAKTNDETKFRGFIALALIAPSAEAKNQVDWSKIQSGKGRFKVLKEFGKQAALDQSTGLVWELAPGDTDGDGDVDGDDQLVWGGADGATRYCSNLVLNGYMGFKLPSIHQLTSLLDLDSDACAADEACLPDKHPFVGVMTSDYWSATTDTAAPANAGVVQFGNPTIPPHRLLTVASTDKGNTPFVWCVRTGQSGPAAY